MKTYEETPMLTTKDNPFNPFEDFVSWLLYDNEKGYNTCDYLGRICYPSSSLSEEENINELNRAIDEVVANDPLGIYLKVTASNFDKVIKAANT